MYLMDLIIKVAKNKSRDLTILAINTTVIILFYYLLFENSEVIYPLILSLFVIGIYFVIEVIQYIRFNKILSDSQRSPDYNNTNLSASEEEILNVIKEIHKDYLDKIYSLKQEVNNKEILFSQWIHNMKTSITVIDLACDKSSISGENNQCILDISEENKLLKKNLEECLNVLRIDEFSRDYITNSYNLKELTINCVNSKKRDFIYKGVFPKVDIDENIYVYTDKKWCSYMIEQILSNAIKYSKDKEPKGIEISSVIGAEESELIIKDYGIGIEEEALNRIFDPFYTGENGRKERMATGIGLYMVKLISNKLGHKIKIESEVREGTTVRIIFMKNKS